MTFQLKRQTSEGGEAAANVDPTIQLPGCSQGRFTRPRKPIRSAALTPRDQGYSPPIFAIRARVNAGVPSSNPSRGAI